MASIALKASSRLVAATPIAGAVILISAADALAHTGTGVAGGLKSGVLHPVLGLDHLLAMLAVGIWGAQMGGRTVWTLPVTFPIVMAAGGVMGMMDLPLPHVEIGIALSMIALGLAIATAWKPAEGIALLIVGFFAIFHGHAHGAELPSAADPAAYAAGFVVATGAIHVAGVGVGLVLGHIMNGLLSRALGAAIALMGVYYLAA